MSNKLGIKAQILQEKSKIFDMLSIKHDNDAFWIFNLKTKIVDHNCYFSKIGQ